VEAGGKERPEPAMDDAGTAMPAVWRCKAPFFKQETRKIAGFLGDVARVNPSVPKAHGQPAKIA
jgi:hypothetical protein